MNTDSPLQNLLEDYVFTVAYTFIERASPDQQQLLVNMVRDTGKYTDQQEVSEVPC